MERRTLKNYEYVTVNSKEWIIDRRFGIHIHKETQIGKGCFMGRNIVIERGVVLGDNVEILDNVTIYPETVIGNNTRILEYTHLGRPPQAARSLTRKLKDSYPPLVIGNNCIIGPFVRIYRGAIIGNNATIYEFTTIREENIIGDEVLCAPFVALNYGNTIGHRVRILHSTHLVATKIEDDVFIAPNVVSVNDTLKTQDAEQLWKGPIIRKGALIGAGVRIAAGVEIGEGARIGMGALVTRDIPPHVFAAGVPAQTKKGINDQEDR